MTDKSHGSACLERFPDDARIRDYLATRGAAAPATPGGSPEHREISRRSTCVSPSGTSARGSHARFRRERWRESVVAAAAGTPATTPMWVSRRAWLHDVRGWVGSPGFATVCTTAAVSVSRATVVAVARYWAASADHKDGRHAAVTKGRMARELGCSTKTVQRCWLVLKAAGFAVEAVRGHGSAMATVGNRASVWHLTSRRSDQAAVQNVPLPPPRRGGRLSYVGKKSPSCGADAPTRNDSIAAHKRTPRRAAPRPLAVQRLAAELVKPRSMNDRSPLLHGVDRGHIGSLCDALLRAGIDPAKWSAKTLVDALNADMKASGWSWPDQIHNPGGFLAARLRRVAAHPVQRPDKTGVGGRSGSISTTPATPAPTKSSSDEPSTATWEFDQSRWHQAVLAATTPALRSQLLIAHAHRTRTAMGTALQPDPRPDRQVAAFATIARRATFDHPDLSLAEALALYVAEQRHHRQRRGPRTTGANAAGGQKSERMSGPDLVEVTGTSTAQPTECGCGRPGQARPFIRRPICDDCWDAAGF